jgi:phage terminase large subunit-like protein
MRPWVGDFIEECAAFPNGAHDDQVDAMTQALLRWHMAQPEIVVYRRPLAQISSI